MIEYTMQSDAGTVWPNRGEEHTFVLEMSGIVDSKNDLRNMSPPVSDWQLYARYLTTKPILFTHTWWFCLVSYFPN
jgi:hypothetical protein